MVSTHFVTPYPQRQAPAWGQSPALCAGCWLLDGGALGLQRPGDKVQRHARNIVFICGLYSEKIWVPGVLYALSKGIQQILKTYRVTQLFLSWTISQYLFVEWKEWFLVKTIEAFIAVYTSLYFNLCFFRAVGSFYLKLLSSMELV